jgi:DNA-directed RNA polymerase specialized sigma24 family protein
VLPPREREVLALARVAGLSVPQIADELGIGPDAVKARMRAGLRALSAAQVRV